jgi:PAS domain S-box-containing protein
MSICAQAIQQRGLFVVPDTTLDPRFSTNPLVTGEPYLRFYAGAVLRTRDGLPLGTLCVLDHTPRPNGLTPEQAFTLEALARQVMTELELRRSLARQTELEQEARDREDHYRHVVELNPQVTWTADARGNLLDFGHRWSDLTGLARGEALGAGWMRVVYPDDLPRMVEAWTASVATGQSYNIEHRIHLAEGAYRWMRSRAYPRRDRTGAVVRWYGSTEDIHDRKLAEQHQRLLVHELNHRVKNTLATVQSLAAQSFRGMPEANSAREQFEARLLALSRAHDVLTRENWERADLRTIIAEVITRFCGDDQHV